MCQLLGQSVVVSIVVAAATLTATSVGITGSAGAFDLGRLHETEGQIILGAAVIDDTFWGF